MVALALSGFSFEKSLWRSQCITALAQIMDPHLRALFAFLTPDNDSYDIVLVRRHRSIDKRCIHIIQFCFYQKESGISLSDRMAFACNYLCDTKLADFVKSMIQNCTDNGDLNGLLVTGTSEAGLNLLQSFLDLTDDVCSQSNFQYTPLSGVRSTIDLAPCEFLEKSRNLQGSFSLHTNAC